MYNQYDDNYSLKTKYDGNYTVHWPSLVYKTQRGMEGGNRVRKSNPRSRMTVQHTRAEQHAAHDAHHLARAVSVVHRIPSAGTPDGSSSTASS